MLVCNDLLLTPVWLKVGEVIHIFIPTFIDCEFISRESCFSYLQDYNKFTNSKKHLGKMVIWWWSYGLMSWLLKGIGEFKLFHVRSMIISKSNCFLHLLNFTSDCENIIKTANILNVLSTIIVCILILN